MSFILDSAHQAGNNFYPKNSNFEYCDIQPDADMPGSHQFIYTLHNKCFARYNKSLQRLPRYAELWEGQWACRMLQS